MRNHALYRWQCLGTIWGESWVRIGYPSGLSELAIFGQCRRWSRKNQQSTDKTKKTEATVVGLLCHKHSWLSFSALEVKKIFDSFKINRNHLLNDVKVHKKGKTERSQYSVIILKNVSHLFAFSADDGILLRAKGKDKSCQISTFQSNRETK